MYVYVHMHTCTCSFHEQAGGKLFLIVFLRICMYVCEGEQVIFFHSTSVSSLKLLIALHRNIIMQNQLTGGHWPFSVHFSKMANQNIKQDTLLDMWPIKVILMAN